MTDDLGTFLVMWHVDGTAFSIPVDFADHLRDKVTEFMETGRDGLLQLTSRSGDPFVIKASCVDMWTVSTEQGRAAKREFDRAVDDIPDWR